MSKSDQIITILNESEKLSCDHNYKDLTLFCFHIVIRILLQLTSYQYYNYFPAKKSSELNLVPLSVQFFLHPLWDTWSEREASNDSGMVHKIKKRLKIDSIKLTDLTDKTFFEKTQLAQNPSITDVLYLSDPNLNNIYKFFEKCDNPLFSSKPLPPNSAAVSIRNELKNRLQSDSKAVDQIFHNFKVSDFDSFLENSDATFR